MRYFLDEIICMRKYLIQAIIHQQVDLKVNYTSETKKAKAEIRQRRRTDQAQNTRTT